MIKNFLRAEPGLKESWIILLLLTAGQAALSFAAGLPMILTYVLAYIPSLAYVYWLGARNRASVTRRQAPQEPRVLLAAVPVAVLVELAFIILISALTSWMKTPQWYDDMLLRMYTDELLPTAVTVCAAAPVLEELLFRRIILRGLVRRMPEWKAVAWSSLLFAVAHLNPWQAVPAFAMGCLFGWIYVRTGRWWSVVLMHAVNNALTVLVVALSGPDAALAPLDRLLGPDLYYILLTVSAVVSVFGLWLIRRITSGTNKTNIQ
ncbi:MAG TPA: CPBP family intramembrane metalloprotease [Candidatus Coprenecus stercoravium]|uniref:CPBP family intramembrane metalloprotease n=1 Tax=Candidatus Coprenecus stercoravium TaxID=2840735 RepID=A0A9D2K8Y1_9BACT|nr:CPBP family intramembrane metalloprotease [Candidatus Coprenecus stercoravium]